jgi:pyruvate,water dikinase
VYSGGNWLSHETTLCRELGKPAVVGLVEEIELIEDGELLRIDGATGTVLRLDVICTPAPSV